MKQYHNLKWLHILFFAIMVSEIRNLIMYIFFKLNFIQVLFFFYLSTRAILQYKRIENKDILVDI